LSSIPGAISERNRWFIDVQGTTDAKTWPVEDVIRARSREQGVKKRIRNKSRNRNRRETG
jgi:hypothetical protein